MTQNDNYFKYMTLKTKLNWLLVTNPYGGNYG